GIEVLVRVGGTVQAAHPAKLVGAFLDLLLRDPDARLLGSQHGQPITDELLEECLELSGQLQDPHELGKVDCVAIDLYDSRHLMRSWRLQPPICRNGSRARSIKRR